MTLRQVANFYFSRYPQISIKVVKWGSPFLHLARYHLYPGIEEFYRFADGFLDDKVMDITFQTYYSDFKERKKCEHPILYICLE